MMACRAAVTARGKRMGAKVVRHDYQRLAAELCVELLCYRENRVGRTERQRIEAALRAYGALVSAGDSDRLARNLARLAVALVRGEHTAEQAARIATSLRADGVTADPDELHEELRRKTRAPLLQRARARLGRSRAARCARAAARDAARPAAVGIATLDSNRPGCLMHGVLAAVPIGYGPATYRQLPARCTATPRTSRSCLR
jgi:hypothetical protein